MIRSMNRALFLIVVLLMQPIGAMHQGLVSQLWSTVQNNPVIVATTLGAGLIGLAWVVTKSARELKYQAQLAETLNNSTDKEQLKHAFKNTRNVMPLIRRCNEAAQKGNIELVKVCFEVGVHPMSCFKFYERDDQDHERPFWNAMCHGQAAVVALCLEHGVSSFTDLWGQPALVRAFNIRKKNIVAAFIECTQQDITPLFEHEKFEWGYDGYYFVQTCMPILAKYGHAQPITYALKKINAWFGEKKKWELKPDEEGFTAVHRAAECGKTEVLNVLLAYDRSVARLIGPCNTTPLMLAAAGGHIAAIQTLWDNDGYHPGDIDERYMTPLAHAAAHGHVEATKKLVQLIKSINACTINSDSLDGKFLYRASPLHHALYREHYEVARYLIGQGADIAWKDDSKNLPLHIAASKLKCPTDLLALIIEKSQQLNVLNKKDGAKQTALDRASVSGSEASRRMLAEAGCISNLKLH